MNRYARSPKKKQSVENEQEHETFFDALVGVSQVPDIAQRHLAEIKPLGRPYRSDEEKKLVFLQLVRLKENRKTHEECADTLGVSIRTIVNYLADPLYAELVQEVQHESKERGHLLISDVIDDAVQKLYALMHSARSEFVQYKSAEYILKIAGYEVPREQRERDNQADVIEFLSKIDERKHSRVQVNVQINTTDAKNAAGDALEARAIESTVFHRPHGDTSPQPAAVPELERYMRPMLPGGKIPIDENNEDSSRSDTF